MDSAGAPSMGTPVTPPSVSPAHNNSHPQNHAAAAAHAIKPTRILACVLCQHRKIKCDRNFPCSNCTKTGVKCTPSTPAPARKRRRPNQDLQERLARCEEMLKEYAEDKPIDMDSPAQTHAAAASDTSSQNLTHSQTTTPRAHAPASDDPFGKYHPPGKLVKEDGAYRFMDNPMLSTIYDELRAMREIVDEEDVDAPSPASYGLDDNSDLLMGYPNGDTPPSSDENLWPEPSHVFRLWQIFLDRVNPLTKIIHVPTLQPFVVEATSTAPMVPKNIEALLYSIFNLAVLSLQPDECKGILGYSREQALHRFSTGVRQSLLRIGFLKTNDLTTLQALVLYVISLQGRYNRHAAWILNGVVVRIAQKMGLHRDGTNLGLGPFEAEMRRRLWWQIIIVDSRYALMSGLTHSMLPRNWDTKQPKNINDTDLFPGSNEPLHDREGPTEMIFCLLMFKIAEYLASSPGVEAIIMCHESAAFGNDNNGMRDEQLIQQIRASIEELSANVLELLDKWCDPSAGPIHDLTFVIKGHIMEKLQELIDGPMLQPGGIDPADKLTSQDSVFKVAICAIEHQSKNYIAMRDQRFLWFSLQHFHVDVFVYLCGQLCHRTEGELVDLAWEQTRITYEYHPELLDMSNKMAHTCAVFILKAWKKREEVIYARKGRLPTTPLYILKVRRALPNYDPHSEPTPPDAAAMAMAMEPSSVELKAEHHQGLDINDTLSQFLGTTYLDTSSLGWDMMGVMDNSMNCAPPGPGSVNTSPAQVQMPTPGTTYTYPMQPQYGEW